MLKYFLLHEDPIVRDAVGFHLYEAWSPDRELVPLVIEACERYGELPVLHLLGFACRFVMTHRGVEETLRVLTSSPPPFAELWIATAPIELLQARNALLARTLSSRALSRLARRSRLYEASLTELWSRLESVSSRLDRSRGEPADWEEADDLVDALAHRERAPTVLARLSEPRARVSPFGAMFDVEIAGAMQLQAATPRLVELLGHEQGALSEAAARSLARLGAPGMIRLLRDRYPGGSTDFRLRSLEVMKAVKLGVAERALRSLLDVEPSVEIRARIFDGLRFHFTSTAAAALREELRRRTSEAPREELEKALFVHAKVSGVVDEDAERFREEARGRGEDDILFSFPLLRRD